VTGVETLTDRERVGGDSSGQSVPAGDGDEGAMERAGDGERRGLTAVVAEGGGQRGIYTAGVLDALGGERIFPFDLGIGVSAGAQNLLAFFLDRPGYARRAIEKLTAAPGFYVPYRWFTHRNVIDLDGYFEHILTDPEHHLEYPRLGDIVPRRRLLFVATCRDTLEPCYLEPTATDAVECMKASSAVPLLYRSGVRLRDRCLMDGGVADPLPVVRARHEGAGRILVIRTGNGDVSGLLASVQRLRRTRAMPAGLLRMIECHEAASREARAFLAAPPPDVRVLEISPSQPLLSQVFGSHSRSLVHDYAIGFEDGLAHAPALRGWGDPAMGSGALTVPPAAVPAAVPAPAGRTADASPRPE